MRKLKQLEAAALLAGPVSFEVKCFTSCGCTAFAQHRAPMDLFLVEDPHTYLLLKLLKLSLRKRFIEGITGADCHLSPSETRRVICV